MAIKTLKKLLEENKGSQGPQGEQGIQGPQGEQGETGINGLNCITLTLYRRSSTDLAKSDCPTSLQYTFSTKSYTGDMNNWYAVIPAFDWSPLWTIQCPVATDASVITVNQSDWNGPTKTVENGAEGQRTATLMLYQKGETAPTVYPSNVYYDFNAKQYYTTESGTTPITNLNGWLTTLPAYNWKPTWTIQTIVTSTDNRVLVQSSEWSKPPVNAFADGISSTKSFVFKRQVDKPEKPGDDEGSYSNPVPEGWHDSVPVATGNSLKIPVWMTSRTFVSTGKVEDGQDSSWSPVVSTGDTDTIDREWNSHWTSLEIAKANPPLRTSPIDEKSTGPDANYWYDEAIPGALFMAVREVHEGKYPEDSSWEISQVAGEAGTSSVTLTLYQKADSESELGDKPDNVTYTFSTKSYSDITKLKNWTREIPGYDSRPTWCIQADIASKEDSVEVKTSDWVGPTQLLTDGVSKFKSIVFRREENQPSNPGTEGSYSNPIPTNWYDSIPAASGRELYKPVWMTSRTFASTGKASDGQDSSWSPVVIANDTNDIEREWNNTWGTLQEAKDNPPTRTSPLDTEHVSPDTNHWYDEPITGARFMAVKRISGGKYIDSSWEISQVGGENGVNTATLTLYQRNENEPENLPGNVYYNFKTRVYSDSSTRIIGPTLNGWKTEIPEYDETTCWCIQVNVSSIDEWVYIQTTEWKGPNQVFVDGHDGVSKFKSTVFRRYGTIENPPAKPENEQGSYSNPVPPNWYDTIPAATGRSRFIPVWMTSRTFTSTGKDGQDSSWSPVVIANDTNDVEREWNTGSDLIVTLSDAIKYPPTRTSPIDTGHESPDAYGWHDEPITGARFMAVKRISGGIYVDSSWEISQVGGEGSSNALLTLYQRAKTAPSDDPANVVYHFDTCKYTDPDDPTKEGTLNGWKTSVPKYDWNPCWCIQVNKSSTDSSVLIKSNEWSDPTQVFADGSSGLNTANLTLYRKSNDEPTDKPLYGLIYNFNTHTYQGDRWDASLNGWSPDIPAYNWLPTWGIQATVSSEDSSIAIPDSSWGDPVMMFKDGSTGVGKFKSSVFKREKDKPNKPNNDEGSYSKPVPTGWSDSVPDGSIVIPVWMTSRTFTSTGEDGQDSSWSPVVCVNDSEYVDYEWNKYWQTLELAKLNPPERTTPEDKGLKNPDDSSWWDNPIPDAKYMAVRSVSQGKYIGEWEITQIEGEHGKTTLDLALYQRNFNTPGKPGDMNYNINDNAYTPEAAKGDWRTDVVPHTYDWSPLWVITAHKTLTGSVDDVSVYTTDWSDPIIAVVDGSTGPEGDSYEYIYGRCETEIPADASVLEIESERQKSQPDYVPNMRFMFTGGSTLDVSSYTSAQGVDASNMYEFVASRRKHNNIWGVYSKPGLCSNWVHAGLTPQELEDVKQQVKAAIEEDIEDIREDLAIAKSDINDASTRLHNLDGTVTGIQQDVTSITETAVFKNDEGDSYVATLIVRGIDASKGTIEDWAGHVTDDKITVYSHTVDVSLGTISNRITVTDGSLANLDTSVGQSFTTVQENIDAHAGTLSLLSAHQGLQDASISGAELAINGLDASIKLTATRSYVDGSIGNVRAEYSAGDASVRAQAMTAVTEARYISKLWSDGSTYLVDSSNYCLYYYINDDNEKVRLYSNEINPTSPTSVAKFYTDERYKNEWQNTSGKTVYIAKHPDDITVGIPINESMSFIRQLSNEVNIAAIDGSAAAQILLRANDSESIVVLDASVIHLNGDVNAKKAAIDTVWIANAKITDASIQRGSIVSADIDLANIHDASIYDASIEDCSIIRGTVAYANMYDSSIKNAKIEKGSIVDASIGHVYIRDTSIEDASVLRGTFSKIAVWDSSINYALIDKAWIRDGSINDCSINRGHIDDASIIRGTISQAKIWEVEIDNSDIKYGLIDKAWIKDGSINTCLIKDCSINKGDIKDASIIRGTISEAGIWEANIHNGTIDNAKITNGSIKDASIWDASIKRGYVMDACIIRGTISEAGIWKGTIDDAEIKYGQIHDASIRDASIWDCSIGYVYIFDASIEDASIIAGTISDAKIDRGSLNDASINFGTIDKAIINDCSINRGYIDDASIEDASIIRGTISYAQMFDASIYNAYINQGTIDELTIKNSSYISKSNWWDDGRGIVSLNNSTFEYLYDSLLKYPEKSFYTENNDSLNKFVLNKNGLTYDLKSGSLYEARDVNFKVKNDGTIKHSNILSNFMPYSTEMATSVSSPDPLKIEFSLLDDSIQYFGRNTQDLARNSCIHGVTFDTSKWIGEYNENYYYCYGVLQHWRDTDASFNIVATDCSVDQPGGLLSNKIYIIVPSYDASNNIWNYTLDQLNANTTNAPVESKSVGVLEPTILNDYTEVIDISLTYEQFLEESAKWGTTIDKTKYYRLKPADEEYEKFNHVMRYINAYDIDNNVIDKTPRWLDEGVDTSLYSRLDYLDSSNWHNVVYYDYDASIWKVDSSNNVFHNYNNSIKNTNNTYINRWLKTLENRGSYNYEHTYVYDKDTSTWKDTGKYRLRTGLQYMQYYSDADANKMYFSTSFINRTETQYKSESDPGYNYKTAGPYGNGITISGSVIETSNNYSGSDSTIACVSQPSIDVGWRKYIDPYDEYLTYQIKNYNYGSSVAPNYITTTSVSSEEFKAVNRIIRDSSDHSISIGVTNIFNLINPYIPPTKGLGNITPLTAKICASRGAALNISVLEGTPVMIYGYAANVDAIVTTFNSKYSDGIYADESAGYGTLASWIYVIWWSNYASSATGNLNIVRLNFNINDETKIRTWEAYS